MTNSLIVKILLGAVAVLLSWFFVGDVLTTDDTDQLLACGVLTFSLAAIILP